MKIDTQKSSADLPLKDASVSKAQMAAKAAKSSVAPNVPRSASQLASAAGLPSNKLSASIISFARFFSLPLKPQVLADIRRQVIMQTASPAQSTAQTASQIASQTAPQTAPQSAYLSGAASSPANQSAAGLKNCEAISLCAAAAESKGTELNAKGLESYAEAVDPDSRRQDGGRQRRESNKNEQDEKACLKSGEITAQGVKEKAFEYLQENPLLEILNRLPGKNGQRWIVLPFDFTEGDKLIKVSMRILINDVKISNSAAFMVLDILTMNSEQDKGVNNSRQVFIIESVNDKPVKITAYHQPELPQKAHRQLIKDLSALLEIPDERVFIKKSEESFPFESGHGEELISIDEAV